MFTLRDTSLELHTHRKTERHFAPTPVTTISKLTVWFESSFELSKLTGSTSHVNAQAGIKTAGRHINNFRYADDTTLMAESKELTSLLMKVKRRVKKLA